MTKYKYQPKFYQPPTPSPNPFTSNKRLGILIPLSIAVLGLGAGYFYTKKLSTQKNEPKSDAKPSQAIEKPQLSIYQHAVQPTWKSLLNSDVAPREDDLSTKFDQIATNYDNEIGMDETVMGLNVLRRYLIKQHASGNVIEFSLGTGRNMKYYNPTAFSLFGSSNQINSFTGIEKSGPMLNEAINQQGMKDLFRNFILNKKPIQLFQMDAHDTSALSSSHYDTVVDTFGLCSYSDPVKVLHEMKRVCKPEGKILLLQHGRGTFSWLNGHLDKHADHHAHKWGCWWNRDILQIIKDAGLDIEYVSRWHFGTTYYIIARPPKPTET